MKNRKSIALTVKQNELLQAALAFHQAGQLDAAEAYYKKLLKVLPSNTTLLTNLGTLALQKGQLEAALQLIDRSLHIDPNQPFALNNRGNALKDLKRLDDALVSFDRAIAINSNYAEAYSNRGATLQDLNRWDDALIDFNRAIIINPNDVGAHSNRGLTLQSLKRLDEAVASYDRAITINANYAVIHYNRGNALKDLSRLNDALTSFDRAIAINSNYAEAYSNRGAILRDLNRWDDALIDFNYAITINPNDVGAHFNRGITLQSLKRLDEAVASYDRAIAINANYAVIYYNRGNALRDLNRWEDALLSFDRALAINPGFAEAYSNRGLALKDLKRLDDALGSFDRAIAINPNYAEAYSNRGLMLNDLKRWDDALVSFDRAIAINPNYAEVYSNRGIALHGLNRLDDALISYDRTIAIDPNFIEAHYNRGLALQDLKRWDDALISFDRAIALKPDYDFLSGLILNARMQICHWDGFTAYLALLTDNIRNQDKVSAPFPMLALIDDPELHRNCATIHSNEKYPRQSLLPMLNKYPKHAKIRIGYFSADFRIHPLTYVTAELYERHDRTQFEIIAFSLGPDTKDEMNTRIKAGADQFYDVHAMSDKEIALLARRLEIDIAVDLGGHTKYARTFIFAMQAAPIQISYMGYPGTMGAKYIDYLIADPTLISQDNQRYYSEKIAYLPNTYWVNDTNKAVSKQILSRAEFGLPATGFIFCCFNSTYKITPSTFEGWMRILKQVEDSVLWLYVNHESAVNNLKKAALSNGVDDQRLIFANYMSNEDHLNRIQLADLFIDTFPYNAHTTTSDALRMGLPVLTRRGESFASRVAASLLNAIHLPELITASQENYESLAILLATHPEKLMIIKNKLAHNRARTPLFNTKLFARHIESAYLAMYDRYQEDLCPDHIYIEHKT